jgi:formylmethanofuran dehydrogenase subunit B
MVELGTVTCAGCGLLCDDVIVERTGDGVRLEPDCHLGVKWFSERMLRPQGSPAATIDGQPVDVEEALTRAAELLRAARRPLLYGFDWATLEDARAAAALADGLGAIVATEDVGGAWPGAPAVPLRGASSATLGEVRDRSRLVVIWREDPETTHPRLLERLGVGRGPHLRRGAEAALVVVDDRDTATSKLADLRLALPREHDLEALSSLHALQRGMTVRMADAEPELRELLHRINDVPHATFVYGPGLTAGAGGERRALTLHELVRELCLGRHVVSVALPAAAGRRGAQEVLSWQTGYSPNIDLASGHPELLGVTRPLDADEGVDVSLCIEAAPARPRDGVTAIALCSLPVEGVQVLIRTAPAGVEAGGTAHRLDGVPLTLQAPVPGQAPTAAALLRRLRAEVAA